jgi:hypothetical protein
VVTSIDVTAQNISVSSFQLDETDLTANLKETIVLDQNGNKCALIKINTTQTNFNFDVGVLGVTDVKYYPAQVWLYVPFGVKRISIMHQQLGSLINWEFPIPIESARTYLMQLTTDEVVTTIKKKATSDYIVFNVKPSNALIYLNDEIMQADNGVASKFVPYGKYTYKVVAPGYHAQNGSVSISQKTVVDISLNPAFGFLNVTSAQSLYGAIVFVDGEAVGQIPLNQYQLSSGYHDVTITKQYTKPYNQKVKISDSETLDLIYTAIDNFSNIQIEADEATNVFINNRLVSSGEWNGKLESGSYIVEWRKQNYKTAQTELHVNGNKDNIIVNQPLLQPIIGSVNILSSPSNSNVEIDGKFVGMTPLYIDEIMAGEHIVNISKDGYTNVNTSFVVSENETTTLNYDLSSVANVTVKIYPYSDANLIIDGVPYPINSYPQTFILSIGKHTISVGDNIKYKYEIKEYNILSDSELEINIEPTKTYSSELKKAQRHKTRNKVSLPLGMGFTIANLGMFNVSDKNGEDNFGGVLVLTFLHHLALTKICSILMWVLVIPI